MTLLLVKPRINYKAREWCKLPYPDHPVGCPNYNHKSTCPPAIPLLEMVYDLSKPCYIVVVEFDMVEHIHKMLSKHPDWSDRQARCVLYWQNGVRKQLQEEADFYARVLPGGLVSTLCPEAMGLNVIATAQLVGVPIKTKPVDKIYKIALLAVPRLSHPL